MKWSFRIGTYRGIGVYVHATFALILIWFGWIYWSQSKDVSETLLGLFFILTLFACVVLHEFGHALTAARYGIRTRDITLLPIGGLARLEKMPDDPRQELWVALAGPAVNVVIAALIWVWLGIAGRLGPAEELSMIGGSFLHRLMVVNVFLVIFNMIPAFPMDGGRVLRAMLALRMDYTRATQIAANLGQGIALLFGFLGFFYNPFLIFIALFVWIGASQETHMTTVRSAFHGIPVDFAMMTDFRILSPDDQLAQAIQLILDGSQQDFPVVEHGHVVGILTRGGLMKALAHHGEDYPVRQAMDSDFQTAHPGDMLQTALERLQTCNCRTMPIIKDGRLVGLVNMENIGEFMMIRTALRRHG